MPGLESDGSIREWVDEETRHVDVVASWESLCETYDALRFSDPLSDAERLEEFKWIVQQMNAFLTKMRNRMLSCRDPEAMVEALMASHTQTGKADLGTRRALVYQKLKQRWLQTTVARLQVMMMEKGEAHGWTE